MKQRSSGMSTELPCFLAGPSFLTKASTLLRQLSRRSWKTSPRATILTPGAESRTFSTAWLPRPPQPIRPTRISSLPAAWTLPAQCRPVATAAPATAAVVRNSRRVWPFVVLCSLIGNYSCRGMGLMGFIGLIGPMSPIRNKSITFARHLALDAFEVVLLLDGPHDAEADELGHWQPPDALRP